MEKGGRCSLYPVWGEAAVRWLHRQRLRALIFGLGLVLAPGAAGQTFTNLHSFTNLYSFSALSTGANSDGANPFGQLIYSAGNLYGTASGGGSSGFGTVFSLGLGFGLTLDTNGRGIVVANPARPRYAFNSMVTLTALPVYGWQFTGWSGDAAGTQNPLPVTMNYSKAITANFVSVVPEVIVDNN